jgi:hypothetical protein
MCLQTVISDKISFSVKFDYLIISFVGDFLAERILSFVSDWSTFFLGDIARKTIFYLKAFADWHTKFKNWIYSNSWCVILSLLWIAHDFCKNFFIYSLLMKLLINNGSVFSFYINYSSVLHDQGVYPWIIW